MKRKTIKRFTGTLAAFLAFLFVFYIVPQNILADLGDRISDPGTVTVDDFNETDYPEGGSENDPEAYALWELESQRVENGKYIRMSDGSYRAVQYASPIHFKTEDGSWEEYDNTLVYETAAVEKAALDAVFSAKAANAGLSDKTEAEINENLLASKALEFAKSKAADGYTVKSSDIDIKFNSEDKSGGLFRIQDGGYMISLSAVPVAKMAKASSKDKTANEEAEEASGETTDATINEALTENFSKQIELDTAEKAVFESKFEELTSVEGYSSRLVYKNMFANADVEYIVQGSSIKENIIVNAKSGSYEYAFDLELNGLMAILNEDGSIDLLNDENESIYMIPAGYAYDSAGNYTNRVEYLLSDKENGSYTLTVKIDEYWMKAEDRAYPVVIDPTVIRTEYYKSTAIKDTYIDENEKNGVRGTWDRMEIGYINSKERIGLIGVKQYDDTNILLPIPASSVIVNATLVMKARSVYGTVDVGIYPVTSAWESHTVTWNTMPSIDTSKTYEYQKVSSAGDVVFDITSIAQLWYINSLSVENGLALKALSCTENNYIYLTTENDDANKALYPMFTIEYRDTKGLESKWTYSTQEAWDTGTSNINHFTGNLVFIHDDITTPGSILPVTVSHVFNSYMANLDFTSGTDINAPKTANFSNMKVGKGFKLSVQETVMPITINNTTWYVYSDPDGTEIYFHDSDGDGKYADEDGYGLIITVNNSSTSERYIMSDDLGNKKRFNSSGYITSITDIMGNKKSFVYSSNRLTSITYTPACSSTTTTQINFTYNTSGALSQITNAASSTDWVKFYYTSAYNTAIGSASNTASGYLRKIEHNRGSTSTYYYNSNGTISYVEDGNTSQKLRYTYTSQYGSQRVSRVYETSSTGATGQELRFTYELKKTTIRNSGCDDIYGNVDDLKTVYLFDNHGRTISAYSTDVNESVIYGTANAEYNTRNYTSSEVKKNNTIAKDSAGGVPAASLVANGDLENISMWTGAVSGNGKTSAADSSQKYLGNASVNISSTVNTGYYRRYQSVTIPSAGKYTLSAYIKTSNVAANGTSGGAYISLDGTLSEKITGTTSTSIQNGWQRVFVTKTFASSGTYNVEFRLNSATGTAWFDCIQLETGNAPSSYNITNCSDFERGINWSTNSSSYYQDGHGVHGRVMVVEGNSESHNYASQTLPIYKPATTTFIIGGWAKADSVPMEDMAGRTRSYRLVAKLNYSDGTSYETYADFNPDNTNWQYASTAVVSPETKLNLTINSITIFLSYDFNVNKAYFNNISLTMEPAQVYEYDRNGNMIQTTDSDGNNTNTVYAPNGVDIVSFTNINGEKYEYTYKSLNGISTHLVQTEKKTDAQCRTLTTTYGYDDYGNNTNTTVSSSALNQKISSSSGYSNSGNFQTSTTDERGKTTTYDYNTALDLLNYVQDANSNRTAYTYDSKNRVTRVYHDANKSGGYTSGETNVLYSYMMNRVSGITTATTDYAINYDNYGNLTGIDAGSNTLVSYEYFNNNGKLKKTSYGNGLNVENVYDHLDRVIGVKYNGTLRYEFTYTGEGQLFSSIDNTTSTAIYYEYDSAGRLVRAREADANGTKMTVQNQYDTYGRAKNSTYKIGNKTIGYGVIYKQESDLVSSFWLSGAGSLDGIYYSYDAFDRLTSKNMTTFPGYWFKEDYTYETYASGGSTYTTPLITSLKHSSMYGSTTTYNYTYDNVGNILTISEGSTQKVSYVYDALGQLTRENNAYANKTYVYAYDQVGNILSKKEYAYTTGTVGTAANTKSYTYGNSTWGDLLTSYDGTVITYDSIGNPLNWRNAYYLNWEGRQLKTYFYQSHSNSTEYTYNADGIRTKKENSIYGTPHGSVTEYTLDGTKILYEKKTDKYDGYVSREIYYYYDAAGSVTGFSYNGNDYYYGKNLQGDVIKIFDTYSGSVVVEYTYDAWGNIISITGSAASTVGEVNPFRYRSYYYDTETGWYYLNSRYYDPVVGRFINADEALVLGLDQDSLVQYNLFAYCLNNPVNYADPNGNVPIATIIGGVIGFIIGSVGGYFLSRWLADKMNLSGWKRALFIGVVTVVITASATAIGAVIGRFVGKNAPKVLQSIRNLAKGAKCFVAGTLITTDEGNIPIENIRIGDIVYSYNPDTGEAGYKQVIATFYNESNELIHITINNEVVSTTPEHPFYVINKGWVNAENLIVDDILVLSNGDYIKIDRVEFETLIKPIVVFNFEVEDFHTYYVGEASILVHNASCIGDFLKSPKKFKDVEKLLKDYGFERARQNGSHVIFKDLATGKTVTVPNHGAKEIAIGTLRSILKQAGLL